MTNKSNHNWPKNAVIAWPWQNAPPDYQALSQHGGDEDWVVFVPHSLNDASIPGLEYNGFGHYGICETSEHPVAGGTVYIGAHA